MTSSLTSQLTQSDMFIFIVIASNCIRFDTHQIYQNNRGFEPERSRKRLTHKKSSGIFDGTGITLRQKKLLKI